MLQHHRTPPVDPHRVVVLGATGFVGGGLCGELHRCGIPLLALGSRELDLTSGGADDQLVSILDESDAVVFASALTREHGRDAATLMRNLAMGQILVTALERRRCAHLVYISSDAVYADSTAGPITEQTPCDPGDLYGLMHFTRERMLMDAAQRSEVVMARVRTTGVYGAGDTHNGYGPNRFMRSIRAERRVSLIGDGEERRDHIYIDDLVKLLVLILRFRSAGLINAASGRSVCFAEVAGLMRELAGADVAIEHLPRERAVTHRHFDISAMRAAFPGFEPRLLEDALRPHSASA